MKILFCTDGSRISFDALKNISGWIKNAQIDMICVIDWSFLPDEISIEEKNFAYSCANMADTILDYAEEEIKYEVRAMEEHHVLDINRGGAVGRFGENNESNKCVRILISRKDYKEIINSSKISDYITKEENNKKKVLLTTDGTNCSLEIINKIIPEMKLEDKEIHICMVNEDPNLLFLDGTLDTNWLLDIQRQQQKYAARALEDIRNVLLNHNIKTTSTNILNGIPAQKIIDYARVNDIDLIILGSRNKSKLDRFLTGSVSKRVLENVVSDIWLIRCKS